MDKSRTRARNIIKKLEQSGIEHVRLETLDLAGVIRGRVVTPSLLEKAFEDGLNMSMAIFSFTVLEHMVPNPRWGPEDGDFYMFPDEETLEIIPYLDRTARVYAWLKDEHGKPWEGDPRGGLARSLSDLERDGMIVQAAYEGEAYLVRKTDTGYLPADNSKCFTADGLDIQSSVLNGIFRSMRQMNIGAEKATAEYGPGQYEVNLEHQPLLKACDSFLTFKQTWRAIARQHGLVGTFMPKPFEDKAGSGLHVHINLVDKRSGRNLFYDPSDKRGIGLSKLGYQFLGGLIEHAPALTAIGACSVNSYRRIRPGTWAPAHACYGVGNRAVMIRVPKRMSRSMRLELRSADGTCNPYLLGSSILAAGTHGVEEGMDPGDPICEDIGSWSDDKAKSEGCPRLPESLGEAIDELRKDKVLMKRVSSVMLEEFIKIKRAEWDDYQCHVSDWEWRTYLETF